MLSEADEMVATLRKEGEQLDANTLLLAAIAHTVMHQIGGEG